jgi:hypothetical protein
MKTIIFFILICNYLFSQNLIRVEEKEYEFYFKKNKEIEKYNDILEYKIKVNQNCTFDIIDYGKSRIQARNIINKFLRDKLIQDIVYDLYLVEPRFSEKFKKPYAEKVQKIKEEDYCTLLKDKILYYNESFKDIF